MEGKEIHANDDSLSELLQSVIAAECEKKGIPRRLVTVAANLRIPGEVLRSTYTNADGEICVLVGLGQQFFEKLFKPTMGESDAIGYLVTVIRTSIESLVSLIKYHESNPQVKPIRSAVMKSIIAVKKNFKNVEVIVRATHKKTGIVVEASGPSHEWTLQLQWEKLLTNYAEIMAVLQSQGKGEKL